MGAWAVPATHESAAACSFLFPDLSTRSFELGQSEVDSPRCDIHGASRNHTCPTPHLLGNRTQPVIGISLPLGPLIPRSSGSPEARLPQRSCYAEHSLSPCVPYLLVGPASVHQLSHTRWMTPFFSLTVPIQKQIKTPTHLEPGLLLNEVIQEFCFIPHNSCGRGGECAHYTHFTEENPESHGGLVTCPQGRMANNQRS